MSVCTFPELTVMIVVPDFLCAVTSAELGPEEETLAMLDTLEDHVSAGVGMMLPFASSAVTVSVMVVPVRMIGMGTEDVTTRESSAPTTGGGVLTVTVAVPLFPSLVAVIVAVPGATAVTTPLLETVATDGVPDDQVTEWPVSVFPFASRVTADSVTVVPTLIATVDGATATDATGTGAGAVTVIAAVPFFPSLVAVMVALPLATAVTTPFADTVATPELLEDQDTARPVSVAPPASSVDTESVVVAPAVSVAVDGVTITEATGAGAGAATVIVAFPVFPSLVAVIVAVPALFAVTTPAVLTLATLGALDAQTRPRPERVFPLASYVIAVSVIVPPTLSEPLVGATATDATGMVGGGVTVTEVLAVLPSLVAVTVALPCAMPVTTPLASTLAVCGALDAHVTGRPVSEFPLAS